MFYRVDYHVAIILAGLLIGLACSRRSASLPPSRIGRAYFAVVLALLGLRIVGFMGSIVQPHAASWNIAESLTADIGSVLFGALFGLALRRADRRTLLLDPAVFSALCVATAATFALAAIGKSFSLEWMTTFFHQSGYSVGFLKCVITVEAFAALALLIPATVLPAILVLTVDMFGAIDTHVHNGDPLNDSTGAIIALIHLAVLATLWTMRRRAQQDASHRVPWLALATGGALCLVIAVAGGILMRHAHP